MNGKCDISCELVTYVSNWMKMAEVGMTRNCLRGDIGLILENLHSVIVLLITGTHYQHVV